MRTLIAAGSRVARDVGSVSSVVMTHSATRRSAPFLSRCYIMVCTQVSVCITPASAQQELHPNSQCLALKYCASMVLFYLSFQYVE